MKFVNLNAPAATRDDIARAAAIIGCEVAALRAVIAVETGGRGFDDKGRPSALFEPHIFYRVLRGDDAKRKAALDAGVAYPKWRRGYPSDSYPRIEAACRIDEELGLQAASWGLPQILGMNHKSAGYASARDMVLAFVTGEPEQVLAMARWICAEGLNGPLARRDWARFARGYNGPSYAEHGYDNRLAKAYAHFNDDRPMAAVVAPLPAPRASVAVVDPTRPVLRRGNTGDAVRALQTALAVSGEYLEVDGDFGPATEAVVRRVQTRLGLTVDGVVGPRTWAALPV